MINLNFNNLIKIAQDYPEHGISEIQLDEHLRNFHQIHQNMQSREQGWLDLPENDELVAKINKFAVSVKGKYSDIVVLGIGGSMLGPLCLLQALNTEAAKIQSGVEIHCLDNIDPFVTQDLADKLNYSTTLFLVQTKSGTTPETLAQYLFFREKVEAQKLEAQDHFVFVTDPEIGYLRQVATEEHIPSFPIPANVGGRFSVLSSVGLVISALAGLDIAKLLNGADKVKNSQALQSQAYRLATTQMLLNENGKNITVMMPYSTRLRTIAGWYTQLLSESIGKEFDLEGNLVRTGLTPVPALGATDQHSQLQLFKEGPNDKLILFIEVQDFSVKVPITSLPLPESIHYLDGRSFNDLINAEFQATRQSLTESHKPNVTITVDQVNETTLGELFMLLQLSVGYLGEMLGIDTYNQPGVERSKVLTREYLKK